MSSWARTQGAVLRWIFQVALQLGHRAVRILCGQGRHVLHTRCVVETLTRSAAPTPLRCPASGAQHPRRFGGKCPTGHGPYQPGRADGRGHYNSRGVEPPLDAVSLEDLGNKGQAQLAGAHARLSIHVCLAAPTTPRESTARTGTRRRRELAADASDFSCGTSCQPYFTNRTAGSRSDRASRWWRVVQ